MKSILERVTNGEVLVADGAMGTMLFQRGLQSGDCPELLNLTRPEILVEVAQLYFEAGSDIIQTNTFGGSPLKLSDYELEDKCEEINSKAVECVKKGMQDRVYISGSCGPSGKLLLPYGDTEPDVLEKAFERQISVLSKAGASIAIPPASTEETPIGEVPELNTVTFS